MLEGEHLCGVNFSKNLWNKFGYTDARAIFCQMEDWSVQNQQMTDGFSEGADNQNLMCDEGHFVSGVQAKFQEEYTVNLAYKDLSSALSSNDLDSDPNWTDPTLDGEKGFQASASATAGDFWYQLEFPGLEALLVKEFVL